MIISPVQNGFSSAGTPSGRCCWCLSRSASLVGRRQLNLVWWNLFNDLLYRALAFRNTQLANNNLVLNWHIEKKINKTKLSHSFELFCNVSNSTLQFEKQTNRTNAFPPNSSRCNLKSKSLIHFQLTAARFKIQQWINLHPPITTFPKISSAYQSLWQKPNPSIFVPPRNIFIRAARARMEFRKQEK